GITSYSLLPVAVDLDGDGVQELIAGSTVYTPNCAVKLRLGGTATRDGFTAVGNLDDDPEPEVVLVANGNAVPNGQLEVFEHDGTRKFGPVLFPGGSPLGPPTLANVDDDPYAEISIAGREYFVSFDHDGRERWRVATQDQSAVTGSSVFDFEGDGVPEFLYSDENNLRIID